jgi:hypothetical protein
MWVNGQRHAPAALYRREIIPVPIVQEGEWVSVLVWTQSLEGKSFASAGNRTPVLQPAVIHYTGRATPALVS